MRALILAATFALAAASFGQFAQPVRRVTHPTQISNLVVYVDADRLGHLASGANITTLTNLGSISTVFTNVGTAPTKSMLVLSNGQRYPTIYFPNADRRLRSSATVFDSTFDTNITVVWVAQSAANALAVLASQGALNFWGHYITSSLKYNSMWNTGAGNANSTPGWGQVASYRYDGTRYTYWCNRASVQTFVKSNSLALSGTLTLGATTAGGSVFNGHLRQFLMFNRYISDAELSLVVDWLTAKNASSVVGLNTILCVGDSQTGTTGGTISYPNVLYTNLTTGGHTFNQIYTSAFSGWTLLDMRNASTSATSGYSYFAAPNASENEIAVIYAGTNDIAGGADDATTVERLKNLCQTYRSRGARIVLVGCPTVAAASGTVNGYRTNYTQWMRTNYTSIADRFVDITADSRFQDPTDTNYFNADGLHLNDTGKILLAGFIYTNLVTWNP